MVLLPRSARYIQRMLDVLLGSPCLRDNLFDNVQDPVPVQFHLVHPRVHFVVGLERDSETLNLAGVLGGNVSVGKGKSGRYAFLVVFLQAVIM